MHMVNADGCGAQRAAYNDINPLAVNGACFYGKLSYMF